VHIISKGKDVEAVHLCLVSNFIPGLHIAIMARINKQLASVKACVGFLSFMMSIFILTSIVGSDRMLGLLVNIPEKEKEKETAELRFSASKSTVEEWQIEGEALTNPKTGPAAKVAANQEDGDHGSTSTPHTIHFFHRNSTSFIELVGACVSDDECQIFFYHIQKAGGTNVGSRLYNWLNNDNKNDSDIQSSSDHDHDKNKHMQVFRSKDWCCKDTLLKKMYHDPDTYCHQKFSTWEHREGEFEEAVRFCTNRQQQQQQDLSQQGLDGNKRPSAKLFSKAIILATYREPISRTLSFIHQQCNHNLSHKPRELQDACHRCSYPADPHVWDSLVNDTNRVLESIQTFSKSDLIAESSKDGTRVDGLFLMDMTSITFFFEALEQQLNMNTSFIPPGKPNTEKNHSNCDFGITSTMIKGLSFGSHIYQNLTQGII
jgi:hypothetical protein